MSWRVTARKAAGLMVMAVSVCWFVALSWPLVTRGVTGLAADGEWLVRLIALPMLLLIVAVGMLCVGHGWALFESCHSGGIKVLGAVLAAGLSLAAMRPLAWFSTSASFDSLWMFLCVFLGVVAFWYLSARLLTFFSGEKHTVSDVRGRGSLKLLACLLCLTLMVLEQDVLGDYSGRAASFYFPASIILSVLAYHIAVKKLAPNVRPWPPKRWKRNASLPLGEGVAVGSEEG